MGEEWRTRGGPNLFRGAGARAASSERKRNRRYVRAHKGRERI